MPGVQAKNYNFGELLPASISGYVYVDGNNNGAKDFGEAPISGVVVALLDADGKPTMSAYDAVKIAFDNRLEASEVRKESYLIPVPAGTTEIALSASLYYMAYPPAFAKRLDLPVPNPVIIAAANKRVEVK